MPTDGTLLTVALRGSLMACTPDLPRGRGWVSDRLADRSGHELRQVSGRRFTLPPGVDLADGLSADEAVAVALWNSPAFQADLARLGFARADLAEAGVLPNPVLSFLFPLGPKQAEATVKWGLGWLWQRPSRVKAARLDATRVADDLVQHGLDLVRDVRLAHAEVGLADTLRATASEDAMVLDQLAKITEVRRNAGDASELEALALRADARTAEVDRADAALRATIARARLRALLGMKGELPALTSTPAPAAPGRSLAVSTRIALAARPDLRAAEIAIEAAGARAGLERARIFDLVGILDGNHTDSGWDLGPGVELPLPIFDTRQGGRIRARAELEQAAWSYLRVRREIEREVAEAHARLLAAQAARRTWVADVMPAREAIVRIASRTFEAGAESHLVVLDALHSLTQARRRTAELDAELLRAAAELERSMGGRADGN